MKRTICLLVLSVFFAGSLAACNTVKGAGKTSSLPLLGPTRGPSNPPHPPASGS